MSFNETCQICDEEATMVVLTLNKMNIKERYCDKHIPHEIEKSKPLKFVFLDESGNEIK